MAPSVSNNRVYVPILHWRCPKCEAFGEVLAVGIERAAAVEEILRQHRDGSPFCTAETGGKLIETTLTAASLGAAHG